VARDQRGHPGIFPLPHRAWSGASTSRADPNAIG
jgi:hypothetical protein